ncbi:MAG: WbqC family protein [Oscillospiraceae bacterium]
MIVSIHQPDYIPYIGYFYKIAQSQKFIFLDDTQYSNDNMHQWNKIKTPQGECRIKIPVEHKFGDNINEVRTRDELKWKEKHLKTIEMNYSKAKYFADVFPKFKELVIANYSNLADMNIAINTWICNEFGFNVEFYRSSDMNIHTAKEERVIDLCLAIGGDTYISGNGARCYQVDEHYTDRGVKLQYTDYQPIEYKQLWKEFVPNMSILDYVFNNGFDFDKIIALIKDLNDGDR